MLRYRCWVVEASSFLHFSGCSDMRSIIWSRRRIGVSKQRTKKQTLMSAFNKGRLRRCSSPQPHYGLSALQQHLQILLRRGDRGNMKVFHEIVQYIRREERRQGGAKANILDAQMQQRQQDTHRLLLIPRKHQRQRQVVDPTAERLRQGQRDFDTAP